MSSIDVIIPARDPGPFLVEALASVAAQTRPPAAVVVVDDGSVDDAVVEAVAQALGASPPLAVTLIRQEPLGRSAARNRGAAATDSDSVLFLDADDLLCPEALATLGKEFDSDPDLEMVHGRVREFADRGYPPPSGARHEDAEVTVRHCGATLLRRSLWQRTGPMDETLPRGEWIDWISRAQQKGATVRHLGEVVMERRIHAFHSATPGDDDTLYLKVARAAILRKREESPHE